MHMTTPATTPSTPLPASPRAATPAAASALDRVGLAVVILAVGIAFVAAALYLYAALTWRSQPFLGVMTTHTLMVDGSIPLTDVQWPARSAGLRRGDQIIGINHEALAPTPDDFRTAFANFQREMDDLFFRQAITLNIRRPVVAGEPLETGTLRCEEPIDGFAACSTVVILQRFPDGDFFGYFVVPFASGLIILLAGAGLVALRPNTQVTRLAALGLVSLSIYSTGMFDLNTTSQYPTLWIAATLVGAGSFIALALLFPVRTPLLIDRPNLRFLPPLLGLGTALILALLFWNPLDYRQPNTILLICTTIGLLSLVSLTARVMYVRARTTSLVVRDQANSILIGMGLALLAGVVWGVNAIANTVSNRMLIPLDAATLMPFFVIFALSIAYAALQYRLFDTDRLISQGVTYGVMLAGLVGGYFLLVFAASLIARETVRADNPLLLAIIIFIMAVFFVPVRTRLQERIDRLYFRKRYN
ncbi:MAG: hypothetical protein NZM00_06580, partial [Anaerolinea sp.]|nr:hypothetical protein [Anaerolinea sp.]